jgi:carbamoyltransferase
MTAILGISAFYHDSAAALVVDGKLVAAAQEERFSRVKHDAGFPTHAVDYCLQASGLGLDDLDYVAFYDKPLVKFERLLETYLAYAPRGFRSFRVSIPLWLKEKVHMRGLLNSKLGNRLRAKLVFTDHHESHAASAFFPSPYESAAIVTLDGVGEWSTSTYGVGEGNRLRLTHHITFPHSLGLLYSAFTYYCGFKVNSGEYKLMGLAPYGRPIYRDTILKSLIDLKDDGSFRMDMDYFNYCQGLTMTSRKFHALFGRAPRRPESRIEQIDLDLAASVQAVTEEAMLRIARTVQKETGKRHLVLAGGVALNCVGNGRILRDGPFDDIWIQPAAGDAGGALGAALFVWHQLLEKPRAAATTGEDFQCGSFLGPSFSDQDVERMLRGQGVQSQHFEDDEALCQHVAGLLADEKIVGWFQGRMEFGPRALGARSILGDPRSPKMQANMNLKIKFRESFRPFAPSVLHEHASEWFEVRSGQESPYMLVVAPVRDEHLLALDEDAQRVMRDDPDLRQRVNIPRSMIPAVTHVDNSARLQTVDRRRNPRFHRLIQAFYGLTGCPMLVNTSFNVRGEPIVCTPQDAVRCFRATEMDALVLQNHVLVKDANESALDEEERKAHLARFELD